MDGDDQRLRREVDVDVDALAGVCPEGLEQALHGPVGRHFDSGGQDPGPATDMQADVGRPGLLEQAVELAQAGLRFRGQVLQEGAHHPAHLRERFPPAPVNRLERRRGRLARPSFGELPAGGNGRPSHFADVSLKPALQAVGDLGPVSGHGQLGPAFALTAKLVVAPVQLTAKPRARLDDAAGGEEEEQDNRALRQPGEMRGPGQLGIGEALHASGNEEERQPRDRGGPARPHGVAAYRVGGHQQGRQRCGASNHVPDHRDVHDRAERQDSAHPDRGPAPPDHRRRHQQHQDGSGRPGVPGVISVTAADLKNGDGGEGKANRRVEFRNAFTRDRRDGRTHGWMVKQDAAGAIILSDDRGKATRGGCQDGLHDQGARS